MTELERCDEEIREHEANLRAGHPEVAGLFRALLDWRMERRLLMGEQEKGNGQPRTDSQTNSNRDHGGAARPSPDQLE
jgi:hypothetical protein